MCVPDTPVIGDKLCLLGADDSDTFLMELSGFLREYGKYKPDGGTIE